MIATGETHSVRDLLDVAFNLAGIEDWAPYVTQDPRFYRPSEVNLLIGDASKAKEKLGWTPKVTFNELDQATIDLYLASEEWRDRAGAYAIQGLGSILVAGLQGDFSNVVGLPVTLLLQLAPNLID